MKLVIQIPCYNEADTLPAVLADLPTSIPGVAEILVQIIDDGSSDRTVEIAEAHGVPLIVRNKGNKGLASSFQSGIDNALRHGADIIVNTDGDNQYAGASISDLVAPIVAGEADIVLGDRNPGANRAFSRSKRFLQRFGSGIVRQLAGIEAPDAVTGFRAYSRQAALQINVMTRFSYTIETLIHAGRKGLTIKSVPVTTNPATRESRLFKSTGQFVRKQLITVLRSCIMYMPLRSFFVAGLIMLAIGLAPVLRFLYFYMIGEGDGKLQSLVIGGAFLVIGYVTMLVAFLGDTIATNRQLSETALAKIREIEVAVARLEKSSKDK